MREQRKSIRHPVRKVGKIVVDGSSRVFNCIILDISEGGALLLPETDCMGHTVALPDRFHLLFRAKRTVYEVSVVRRAVKTLAVRFLSSVDLLTTADERFAHLRYA